MSLKEMVEGKFTDARDCTYDYGMNWLKAKYPNAHFTHKTSPRTGNLLVKVDGSLALKEESMSTYGFKLCNEFASQWEEENPQG